MSEMLGTIVSSLHRIDNNFITRHISSCSLNCYKQHKDTPDCSAKLTDCDYTVATDLPYIEEPTVHEPFKTEDTVAKDILQQLGMLTSYLFGEKLILK